VGTSSANTARIARRRAGNADLPGGLRVIPFYESRSTKWETLAMQTKSFYFADPPRALPPQYFRNRYKLRQNRDILIQKEFDSYDKHSTEAGGRTSPQDP
jgi:hypothetical protein